ncbi:phosphatase PAP2 family protein [Williamsia serinedens]|uniref:Undecaprenyl-diphosphatase n=1 Tax=Williamsia serinedens TaxID=391736 RepID=A0ABT1H0D0_9NOCA|nr:phosphatase PAP2 family protein [Williamsia serinedens]MCP2160591.1 undecaprenyl-diphosphatase [Williamsia serinedens]
MNPGSTRDTPSRHVVSTLALAAVWLLGLVITAHHNPVAAIDTSVWEWWAGHRSPGTTAVVSALTVMFSPVWIGIWTVIAAGFLAVVDRSVLRAAQVMATVVAVGAVCEIVKLAVGRARPPVASQIGGPELSLSFPSGHVSGTAALAIGFAVVVTARSTRARRVAAIAIALAVTVVAAVTRLYLELHWLTDVVAAMVLAGALAAIVPTVVTAALSRLGTHVPERIHPYVDPSRTREPTTEEESARWTVTQ